MNENRKQKNMDNKINNSKTVNKINLAQKKIFAEFMMQHRDLASNNLPNTAEGKIMANRLWAHLKVKLNAEGPPRRDAKLWRKVFRDLKHQIKKKSSDDNFRGGATNLTKEDHQIIEAAGLDVVPTVQENLPLPSIENFFTITEVKAEIKNEEPFYMSDTPDENDEAMLDHECLLDVPNGVPEHDDPILEEDADATIIDRNTPPDLKPDCVLSLLNDKLKNFLQNQEGLNEKLDKLLEMNERSLQMKQEEHEMNMSLKRLEFKIKTIELELLKTKSAPASRNTF